MRRALSFPFLACCIAFLSSCSEDYEPSLWNCWYVVNTLFQKETADIIRSFKEYPLEDKMNIYLCGQERIHPPRMYLTDELASEGVAVVPLIRSMFLLTKDDSTTLHLVYLLIIMKRIGSYDMFQDAEMSALVVAKVGAIIDPDSKRYVERMIDEARRHREPDRPLEGGAKTGGRMPS